jgi:hypothetical protein
MSAATDGEGREPDRFDWLGADEETIEVTSSRIARRLSRAATKVVGLLPTGRDLCAGGPAAPRMAPLLASLAGALARFVDQEVAIIDHWRAWNKGGAASGAGARPAPARLREVRPRVIEITPLPSDDAAAAAVALQNTLRLLRGEFGAVLVDLGGYADAGTAPALLAACDGVVLVVTARHARIDAVGALLTHVPSAKRLGAILIGSRS